MPAAAPRQPVEPAEPGEAAGPLAGLLVVDLSRVLAGPFATMMLADLGARVVKVEQPAGGDDSRTYGPFLDGESQYFQRVNRGKESIALDLKDPADRAVLLDLVDRADLLVENFRPGVMARLGLDYPALSARNPGLVYVSLSGFGQTGPLRGRPAYDAVVQGMSGLMSITGSADGHPVKPGAPVADLAAGLYGWGGALAALIGRGRTGRGAHVDVAMFDATVSLLEGAALSYLATGVAPERIGNAHYAIAPFDTFATAEGDITVCAANDTLFRVLCAAIDRPGLAEDPSYATNAARHEHRAALKAELEGVLGQRPSGEWLELLGAAGVPCGPVWDVAQAVSSPQTAARRMVVAAGPYRLPGNPVKLSGYPDPATRRPAPGLDADGARIRAELGTRPAS